MRGKRRPVSKGKGQSKAERQPTERQGEERQPAERQIPTALNKKSKTEAQKETQKEANDVEEHEAKPKDGKKPEFNDAISYVNRVQARFIDKPEVYKKFLDILGDYQKKNRDMPQTMRRISTLFAGYPDLIKGFDAFMPDGYGVKHQPENKMDKVLITTPKGTTVHDMKSK